MWIDRSPVLFYKQMWNGCILTPTGQHFWTPHLGVHFLSPRVLFEMPEKMYPLALFWVWPVVDLLWLFYSMFLSVGHLVFCEPRCQALFDVSLCGPFSILRAPVSSLHVQWNHFLFCLRCTTLSKRGIEGPHGGLSWHQVLTHWSLVDVVIILNVV